MGRWSRRRGRRLALVAAVVSLGAGGVAMADPIADGLIGPGLPGGPVTGNGRQLHPYGRLTTVGNLPVGGAVTPDGRFYWTASGGRGHNDVQIVAVATGTVVQVIELPGAQGGIVMAPDRAVAYVSGTPASDAPDIRTPPGTKGQNGEVLHVFTYDATTGVATEREPIPIPAAPGAPTPQNFPPTNSQKLAWPAHLAMSPDGRTLLVPLNLSDAAAIVDTLSKTVRYVATGKYPYGAAVLPDGRTGLVSNETDSTVSVIDLAAATKIKDIVVSGHLAHPEAIAVDPLAPRAYVAVANTDQVAVINTRSLTIDETLFPGREAGRGTSPTALTVTPDGGRLLVAESGADEIAVFSLVHEAAPAGGPVAASPVPPSGSARGASGTSADAPAATPAPGATPPPAAAARRRTTARRRHRAARRRLSQRRRCRRVLVRHRRVRRCVRAHQRGFKGRSAGVRATGTGAAGRSAASVAAGAPDPNPDFALLGRIPTAAYPTDVQVTATGTLVWAAAKGAGTGPNAFGNNGAKVGPTVGPNPYGDDGSVSVGYLPTIVKGQVGVGPLPAPADLPALTRTADAQVVPINAQAPPADTPLRPGGPIKHVFYIVKENRTYDQVYGDIPKGDGDPSLLLFGRDVTPNQHALVERFGLVDHFYANSEASIDGHFWTSAGAVSDYVVKNWNQNYRNGTRPYDFGVYAVTWPGSGFLFDQTDRQGVPYFNYGEAIAGTVPLTDKDRPPNGPEQALVARKTAKSDLGPPEGCYSNDASIGTDVIAMQPLLDSDPLLLTPPQPPPRPTTLSRTRCFRARFAQQDATGTVPAFNYMVMTNDHTLGTSPGKFTPRAMVADNDLGVGQVVDAISHSSIWSSSAIFVVEDDSQNGPDHVDAHRMPVAVISPYTKPGAVIHTRYDFPSMLRSMELILGLQPLGLNDAVATPMYDVFQSTPANAAPFTALTPTWPLYEVNPAGGAAARQASRLSFRTPDRIPQHVLDAILYRSVRGRFAPVPTPGPNAVPGG